MIEYVIMRKEDYEKAIKLLEEALKFLKDSVVTEKMSWI